jgi:periodic tryptophan protein 1
LIEANTTKKGNYAIVASFLPEIEIWNLDVVNVIEPTIILGGEADESSKKRVNQFKQKKKLKQDSHTDSVISLGLNRFKSNLLCSGSADHTVKLWDIVQQKNVYTYQHHQNKVLSNFLFLGSSFK